MSVYEALVSAKRFKYHGKIYSCNNRFICIRANSVTFVANSLGNEQPLTFSLRELRVRKQGDIIYILDRKGKIVITILKSS